MTEITHYTLSELKNRGWTASLVRDLLGDPDDTRTNPRYKSASPMRLYCRERVREVEAGEAWATIQATVATRRIATQKASQTRHANLIAYVDALTVTLPALGLQEVFDQACEDYNNFKAQIALERGLDFRPATPDSAPEFLVRIAVNFLRHVLSCYEVELMRIAGKTGVGDAYIALSRKVYAAIAIAYPPLRGECERQMAARAD